MALLCGLCEVLFDVDAGNQVQHCVPAGAFSDAELADIAFSAFPDSLSMELSSRSSVRDSCFAFRLRRRRTAGSAVSGAAPPHQQQHHQQQQQQPPPAPFVYAHVFCRQRHDARLRRGCEQKSVVLLSHLPLPGLLEQLARLVGPVALSAREQCADVLHQVYEEVLQWPPLEWGSRLDQHLLGLPLPLGLQLPMLTTLPASALPAAVAATLHRAERAEQPQAAEDAPAGAAAAQAAAAAQHGAVAGAPVAAATAAQVAAALADELDGSGLPLCLLPQAWGQQELEPSPWGDCDAWTPLRAALPQLWALWELLLLGEPLMVVSPSPGACSGAVAALLSLLAPFPYCLDFRPYFTIHDDAFARLAAGELPTPTNALPLLVGITNLYLIKALPGWPNVLSAGFTAASLAPSPSSDHLEAPEAGAASAANGSSHGGSHGGGLQPSESASSLASSAGGGGGRAPTAAGTWLGGTLRRTPTSPAALLSAPVDCCWLQYKPCCRPDRAVLDRLVTPQATDPAERWRRAAAVNSGILRRHFQELTKALLFPLLPFLTPAQPPAPTPGQSADPRAAEAAAASAAPPLPPWDPAAVLEQLGGRDAVLPDILLQRFGGQKELLRFYARFLRSPAMAAFMHTRRLAAEEWQRQEWAAAAAAAAAPMRELLSVEAFFRVEQQLSAARVQLSTAGAGGAAAAEAAALAEALQRQLQVAFAGLPADLQQAVLATPCHAELLGGAAAAAAPMVDQVDARQEPEGAAAAAVHEATAAAAEEAAAAATEGEPAAAAAGEERGRAGGAAAAAVDRVAADDWT